MLSVVSADVRYRNEALVIKGASLEVRDQSIVAILGANGAGKSTLLKAISGAIKSEEGGLSRGSIVFEGDRIDTLPPESIAGRGIRHVPEGRRIFPHLTVEQNLVVGCHGVPGWKRALKTRLDLAYDYFPRLAHLESRTAGYLSGGEQQMLVIGMALAGNSRLLLLDEPSLGLAPKLVRELYSVIEKMHAQEGVTVALVEQNVGAAMSVADYVYVLENGRVVAEGEPGDLLTDQNIKEFYLGVSDGKRRNYSDVKYYQSRKRWV